MISVGIYIGAACVLLAAGTLLFVFNVRLDASDYVPHRTKLRDLRFEFRAGKYSEKDYEEIKQSLEIEAARVLAEMDTLTGSVPTPATRQAAAERARNS